MKRKEEKKDKRKKEREKRERKQKKLGKRSKERKVSDRKEKRKCKVSEVKYILVFNPETNKLIYDWETCARNLPRLRNMFEHNTIF